MVLYGPACLGSTQLGRWCALAVPQAGGAVGNPAGESTSEAEIGLARVVRELKAR